MTPNVPKLTTAALKMSSSRISSASIFAANSAFRTGFDALSIHSVLPLPVANVQAGDEVGHRPEGDLRAMGVARDRARDGLAVADPGGLNRAAVGVLPRNQLEVGVQLGDL